MDHYLIEHCAPTLASIKTANLFMTRNDNHDLVMNGIRHLNQLLTAKGIRVMQYAAGIIHFATRAFYVFACAFMSILL